MSHHGWVATQNSKLNYNKRHMMELKRGTCSVTHLIETAENHHQINAKHASYREHWNTHARHQPIMGYTLPAECIFCE